MSISIKIIHLKLYHDGNYKLLSLGHTMINMNRFKYIIMPSITYLSIVQRRHIIPFVSTRYKVIGKNTNAIKNVGKSIKIIHYYTHHCILYST